MTVTIRRNYQASGFYYGPPADDSGHAWTAAWTHAFMLLSFGVGAVLITINFLSLRQSVTPAPMLGRMTNTMRWLILLPAGPGALLGGWLGEHLGLRVALGFAGTMAVLLSLGARRLSVIRTVRTLPTLRAEAVTPYSSDQDLSPSTDQQGRTF